MFSLLFLITVITLPKTVMIKLYKSRHTFIESIEPGQSPLSYFVITSSPNPVSAVYTFTRVRLNSVSIIIEVLFGALANKNTLARLRRRG